MFSSRVGWYPPATGGAGFGNNAFWSSAASTRWLQSNSATDLITWKAATGFTVEYWIYLTSNFTGAIPAGPGNKNFSGTNYWSFGPASTSRITFFYWGPGTNYIETNTSVFSLNTWTNIAMVATTTGSNTTVSIYKNGVRQQVRLNTGSFADSQTVSNGIVVVGTPFNIGSYGTSWVGYMDELRVSNTNRYSGASYTVAASPFTSDAQTQLLLNCDGANGSTTFTDTSSFARAITNNANNVVVSDANPVP